MRCHICDGELTNLKLNPITKKIEPCSICIEKSKEGEYVFEGLPYTDLSEEDVELLMLEGVEGFEEPVAPEKVSPING